MRKSSLAVLPSISFRRVGSCRPGTCTRMRSTPWRWISGSTVPSSLTRRSMIWIDCSTACRTRSVIAGCGHGQADQAATGVGDVDAALAGRAEQCRRAAATVRAAWSARSATSVSLAMRTSTLVAAHGEAGVADRGVAQHAAHVVAHLHRACPCARHWRRLRAGCASRPADRGRARHDAAPISASVLTVCVGKEVRHGATGTRQGGQQDRQRLPPREIQHGRLSEPAAATKRAPISLRRLVVLRPARPWRARR